MPKSFDGLGWSKENKTSLACKVLHIVKFSVQFIDNIFYYLSPLLYSVVLASFTTPSYVAIVLCYPTNCAVEIEPPHGQTCGQAQ